MRLRSVVAFFLALASSVFFASAQIPMAAAGETASVPDRASQGTSVHQYHDHGIRDIDAIGTRNVGCGRGLGNWYSLERQIAMGRDYSAQVESTAKMIRDPEITEYVNRIGQNIVRNSDSQVPFLIKVIDSDDINAFALPGGFFYMDAGLILAADSEAELAGVMAHEIAHVAACHAARGHTRGQLMNLASIPLIMVGGPIGYVAYQSMSVAMPLTYLKFSRRFETEADYLGVQYMYKAGYDPQALTGFFEKLRSFENHKESAIAKAFRTHPQTPDRIERTKEEISSLLPPHSEYKVDSSEFQDVKARLNQLQDRMRLRQGEAGRPTLRRRPHSASEDSQPN
jgi:predicted Zn-dependent protease